MTTSAVLVYNATYEPISRTKLGRALALVMRGDAVIEESDPERFVRHKNGSFPWPKIIRLLRYVKVPFKYGPVPWSKRGVMRRDNGVCGYCSKPATTIDHIHPQCLGGQNTWMNTVAACIKCNSKKADKTLKQAYMTLLIEPYEPKQIRISYS